jgi:cytochrome P450
MTAVQSTRRIRDLPGPPGLPLVGNLLQVQTSRLHLIVEGWQRTYGDYFRFALGGREFFVVANPEAIAAALRDRPDGFQRTSRLSATAQEMGFGGVFSANGEAWRRQRPMVMAGFDPSHIKTYFPALVRVTERFARRWQRAAAADINTLESDE